VQSAYFNIGVASKVCTLTSPNVTTQLAFDSLYTFAYSCTGYDPGDTSGRLSLVDNDGTSSPLTLPMDSQGHALLSSATLDYQLPPTGTPGWALQVKFTHGSDTPQYSYLLTVQQSDPVCTVSGYTANCQTSGGVLAAGPRHAVELLSLDVTFAGVDCNSPKAALTLVATWRMGIQGANQQATTTASLRDNQDVEQGLFGTNCAGCFDVLFRFVEYLNDRKQLQFDLLLVLPNSQVAPLLLDTLTFVNTQVMCVSAVTNPPTVMTMTPPPTIVITVPTAGATLTVPGDARRTTLLSAACALVALCHL